MAGRPKEKYNPGELKRVKENLGQLSREEAKRMTRILGGEIGIEQTDKSISNQYKEISNQNKKKNSDKWVDQQPLENDSSFEEVSDFTIKYSYLEKIKLFYLASHPDHSIKTTKQIIRAVFDLLSKQQNYINPNLIESSNYFFNKSIQTMVKSTRLISKGVQKKHIRREENPFYWLIIDTICSWDIEGIQEEIFQLKRISPKASLESWAPLIRMIYSPLIRLSKVNRKNDIEGAINYIYKLSIEGLFKKDLQTDRLRKAYSLAVSEINNVFVSIKFRLYPFLLMFVSSKAYDYNSMFKLKGQEILNFLHLEKGDLYTYFERKETPTKNVSIQQGIIFLNKMFPEAGWNRLSENPDMFPYFKTILNIPNEISLISQNDSLQRIVILIAILKDMFYGFSNIQYGFLINDLGKSLEIKDKMNLLIKDWYLFIDELILKHYLTPLNEYCRHLERSTDLAETDYTKRIASDILWIKKTYISPNMSLNLPKIMQPRTKTTIPKLYDTVKQLRSILGRMVQEIFSQGEIAIGTIRNFKEQSWFEIGNTVSKRLNSILKEEKTKLSNGILILYTYEIVEVLHSLIQSTDNITDSKGITGLFRSEQSNGYKPIYSVSSVNTFFRITEKKLQSVIDIEKETGSNDLLTGFIGKEQFQKYILQFIMDQEDTGSTFSIIQIQVHNLKSYSIEDRLEIVKKIGKDISKSIRLLKDIPFRLDKDRFYVILPEKDTSMALKTANRIFSTKSNQLYIGVCEYKENMGNEQILIHLENTISKQLPTPGITYYDIDSGKYIQQPS